MVGGGGMFVRDGWNPTVDRREAGLRRQRTGRSGPPAQNAEAA
jgi:hypothetical protein